TLGDHAVTISKVHLPEVELLIQADRDLYQALVAERALLQLEGTEHTNKLLAEQRDNARQAFERLNKSLDISNTSTSQEREEFTRRYNQWKALADQVISEAADVNTRYAALEKSYGAASVAF